MPKLIPDGRPQRVLVASNLIYTMGSGLYLTAGVLHFTQAVRLPGEQVGSASASPDSSHPPWESRSVISPTCEAPAVSM